MFLVSFKDRGGRVSPRFHLAVSDINQGNKETEIFLREPRDGKILPRSPDSWKKSRMYIGSGASECA